MIKCPARGLYICLHSVFALKPAEKEIVGKVREIYLGDRKKSTGSNKDAVEQG